MEEAVVVRRRVLVDHHSIRRVAREMGISRNTVRRSKEEQPRISRWRSRGNPARWAERGGREVGAEEGHRLGWAEG